MKNFLPLQLLLLLTASLNPAVIVAENITAAQWVVSGAEGKPLHAGPSAVGGNPLARAVAQSLHKRRQHKHLQQHQQNPEHAPKLLTHAAKQHGSERHVLANAAQQPPEGHRLRPVLEAARNFLSIEAPVQRKRLALLHALEGQSPDAAHPLSDAAAAVNRALVDFGEHMSCRIDTTLPRMLPQGHRYLVAANLRNNAALMPHWMKQLLLALLADITSRTDQADGHCMVSIYESGSGDDTPKFVAILELLLTAVGIPNTITASGTLMRGGQERIAFLAKVRNAALSPLERTRHYPAGFPADKIVFLNDVWFCSQDITRLAQYRSADIACGMDFDQVPGRRRLLREVRDILTNLPAIEEAGTRDGMGAPAGRRLLGPADSLGSRTKAGALPQHLARDIASLQSLQSVLEQALGTGQHSSFGTGSLQEQQEEQELKQLLVTLHNLTASAATGNTLHHQPQSLSARTLKEKTRFLQFYDTWVARDVEGNTFQKGFPVVKHGPSADALREGWPFPAMCCWNGLAVLNAAPFRQHKLLFRAHVKDECKASECSLMCDDFWRLGYQRVIVDPSVRQTYVPWDPTLYYDNLLGHAIPLRRWSELVASHIAKGWMKIPEPPASNTSSSSPAGTTTNATATSTPAPASGGGAAAQPQVASGAGNLTINNGTSQTFSPANRRHRSSSRRALHSWWSDFWGSGSEEEDGSGTSGGRDAGFQGAEEGDAVAGFWRDIHAPGTEICCNKQDNADWVDFGSCSPVGFLQPNHTATALEQWAKDRNMWGPILEHIKG